MALTTEEQARALHMAGLIDLATVYERLADAERRVEELERAQEQFKEAFETMKNILDEAN